MHARILTFTLLLATVAGCAHAEGEASSGVAEDFDPDSCAAWRYTGKHESDWGFTFTIPTGLVGLPNSGACTYHGTLIPLAPETHQSGRHIDMFAGYEVLDATSAEEVCIRYVRPHHRAQLPEPVELDGQPGFRVVATFTEEAGVGEHTADRRCFLRKIGDHEYEYVFLLVAPSDLHKEDLVTFEEVLASLRWSEPSKWYSERQPNKRLQLPAACGVCGGLGRPPSGPG